MLQGHGQRSRRTELAAVLQIKNGPAIVSAAGDEGSTLLPITYLTQAPYDQLCWAACCAMVLRADGQVNARVTSVAAQVVGQPCSANPSTSPCNQSIDPEVAIRAVGLAYSVPAPQGPLVPTSLVDWIVTGRKPIEVFWRYQDNPASGHVVLIVGYDVASQTWCVFDPLLGPSWQSYNYLMHYGGTADWIKTFYALGAELG